MTTATATLVIGTDAAGQPVTLPPDVLTHTMAILAKKGAGKTYTAGVIEEEFAKAGLPFVVLDPVGVHYGIRSNRNGKRSAYSVVVFGGEHGDIPIERKMGAVVAQAVVEENISCIVDLTELSKTAWREFVRDFCRELYRSNRSPRHVFIEEATEFVPQTRRPELQEAYEAVERLVRMGRNRGIGCTLISQRSAQVAKDVLTQLDVLIALRTVGPQDRKALLDIFEDVLEADQLPYLEEFKATIARLPDGTAWVWSPEFMRCFTQVRVRERETYHAGATPTFGAVDVVQARPDVSALKARFAALREPAEEPRTTIGAAMDVSTRLRARIAELEGERDAAREGREALRREFDAMTAKAEEAVRMGEQVTSERDTLKRQLNGVASLRRGLIALLGDGAGAGAAVAAVDEDAIVQRVLARLPAGNAPVMQVTPPEALRKKHLETAVDRLMARVRALSDDAVTAIEYLIGQDIFVPVGRMAKAITGSDSGSMYGRWNAALKELEIIGLVAKGGSGKSQWRAEVRRGVEAELAAHGGTDAEITAVEQQVLYRLSQLGESTTS